MPRHIVLLRGVNVGGRNRLPMATLRAALTKAGFGEVETYLQSGNVVVTSGKSPETVAAGVSRVIKRDFGLDIACVVRSRAELAEVVRRDPLAKGNEDPRRHLVTFLSAGLRREVVEKMRAAAGPGEELAVVGREAYSYHPDGAGRSPLFQRLSASTLGVLASSRNWATVTALLAMAGTGTDR
jgi:uncharacterized protein (DUF1697 family)